MAENIIKIKSFSFALRVVKMCQFLSVEKKEFVLSKQLLRSGTSIGALVRESEHAESKSDFIHKMKIAAKEADETEYWLSLLDRIQSSNICKELLYECLSISKVLSKIISSSRNL